jgi:4-hydroxy-3-methylbut-2-en-1-yl diphosphate reductase
MSEILVLAPLRLEAAMISWGAPSLRVHRVGMGAARCTEAARWLQHDPAQAIVVMGVCGGLAHGDEPGEVIVAERVWAIDDAYTLQGSEVSCAAAATLTEGFLQRGLRARTGAIACSRRIVHGDGRAKLAEGGADAVEMESAWLAPAAGERPFIVVRVVADTPRHDLRRPDLVLGSWLRAAGALRRAARELESLTREGGIAALTG